MNSFLQLSWLHHLFFVGHISCTSSLFLSYSSNPETSILTSIEQANFFWCRNNRRKFANYKDMHSSDLCICEALCLLLFLQVIKVTGKYMHRQTRSYQGDLIQWVQDISLIGLSSISHAQKVSVSSYHTPLLWNHFLSWREKTPQGKHASRTPGESDSLSDSYTYKIFQTWKSIWYDNRFIQKENY